MSKLDSFQFQSIGVIHSCFKEKFGIPRQPGLVPEARAILELREPYAREEAFRGLEEISHVWIVFVFHASMRNEWKPMVRPPRLGGNQRLGVFATRSPFRPNPVGLSVVELEKIEKVDGMIRLHLKGVDFLDGTPVLDIKPYVSYVDSVAGAQCGFAQSVPEPRLKVEFTAVAEQQCCAREQAGDKNLRQLICQILASDPRPAYKSKTNDNKLFGMRLKDFDLKWKINAGNIFVMGLDPVDEVSD